MLGLEGLLSASTLVCRRWGHPWLRGPRQPTPRCKPWRVSLRRSRPAYSRCSRPFSLLHRISHHIQCGNLRAFPMELKTQPAVHTNSPGLERGTIRHSIGEHCLPPKTDLQDLPTYDGTSKSDPDLWYRKIRNHLVSQHTDIKTFLDWAESNGATRTTLDQVERFPAMLDLDPRCLANEIWGSLTQISKGMRTIRSWVLKSPMVLKHGARLCTALTGKPR